MAFRLSFVFSLLIWLLLSACIPRTPSKGTPTQVPTTIRLPTKAPADNPTPTKDFAPTENPSTVSGEFQVRNTSPDLPEVLVETMEMLFEYQLGSSDPWQSHAATCDFDPLVPFLVRETQPVRYDCQLKPAPPPGAELRATVEIRLFGSDQIFRLQVEQ